MVYSDDDRTNLLAQAVLDKKLREWGRADLFVTFDWVSPNSFPLMVDPPSPFATAKAALPDFTNQVRVFLSGLFAEGMARHLGSSKKKEMTHLYASKCTGKKNEEKKTCLKIPK